MTFPIENLPRELLVHLIDNYLIDANPRLPRVHKQFRNLTCTNPLVYLSNYVHAQRNGLTTPPVLGHIRWSLFPAYKQCAATQIQRIDPSLRGIHHFLSLDHDFSNPHLEDAILSILKSVKWIARSLAHTAKNQKIKAIAQNCFNSFKIMCVLVKWNEKTVGCIDWKLLQYGGYRVENDALQSLYQPASFTLIMLYIKNFFTTFFHNWDFALYALHVLLIEEFYNAALPVIRREFPEKQPEDYLALNDLPALLAKLKQSEAEKSALEITQQQQAHDATLPTTTEAFIEDIQHYPNINKLLEKPFLRNFTNDMSAMLALMKKFPDAPLTCYSPKLLNTPEFLYKLAKYHDFTITDKLQADEAFIIKILSIRASLLKQVKQRKPIYIETALKQDPWVYKDLEWKEKRDYEQLYHSLIPPHSQEV